MSQTKLTEAEILNLQTIKMMWKKAKSQADKDAILYLCPSKLRPFLTQK